MYKLMGKNRFVCHLTFIFLHPERRRSNFRTWWINHSMGTRPGQSFAKTQHGSGGRRCDRGKDKRDLKKKKERWGEITLYWFSNSREKNLTKKISGKLLYDVSSLKVCHYYSFRLFFSTLFFGLIILNTNNRNLLKLFRSVSSVLTLSYDLYDKEVLQSYLVSSVQYLH